MGYSSAAFSIIYQKRFLVFLHSTLGARTRGVLHVHGLEDRLYQEGAEIDAPIDWEAVQARSQEKRRSVKGVHPGADLLAQQRGKPD